MSPTETVRPVGSTDPAPETPGLGERIPRLLLSYWPLGPLVRGVARTRASVHAKLAFAFLLIALLLIAMGGMGLRSIASVARHSRLLDQARERVDASRQIEHALGLQMNFTRNALLLRDDATIESIFRENNRFRDTFDRLEAAAPPDQRETIQRLRMTQDKVMATVARIAALIREDKPDEAMDLHLSEGYPLYREIATLVTRAVRNEEAGMGQLREGVEATYRRALLLTGGFAAASIMLALGLGFVISWSFILPVREAEGFLGQVAKGDFSASINVPNRDEFGALARRMNEMSRELHQLYDEQRRAAHQLRALNAELEQASRAKSNFLASMSHELRTPMNAILGFTEMIRDGLYGEVPLEIQEPVSDIHTCGKQLLGLINNVLDLSKIEAGHMELALGEYLVEDVVNTVTTSLRSLAVTKGLDLVTAVPPDLPVCLGDAKRITQCLMNLAGNALKFTQEGRVEIRVERQGEALLFAVSDTGIGIPADQVSNIFEEFRQADATVSRDFGGTGLGLSITRKLVELHGGRIWVESLAGKGSTFFFSIPVRVAKEATA
ncbi:MAG TPA: ATP-binding protein [Methylomirabilota bacterium]|nr:ATP-binding protein [Methylomirabilota bacterium]